MEKPIIICLTPVRNEAWILDRFLSCTSLWADYIIIADQHSTDGSREIAKKYTKVILIENESDSFNEPERQRLLINEARKIKGKRLLIALDADEIFVSDFDKHKEWGQILSANKGESFSFELINVLPGFKKGWYAGIHTTVALMDYEDIPLSLSTQGLDLHLYPRLPNPKGIPAKKINKINILHLQYTLWDRMKSKHRHYLCLERIYNVDRDAISLYRMYHHMYSIKKERKVKLHKDYYSMYLKNSIAIDGNPKVSTYWYDSEVLHLFERYGTEMFKKENIWETNWRRIAKSFDKPVPKDPRSLFDKFVHIWLKLTQPFKDSKFVLRVERTIRYRCKW
jgi:glycosyltransferase involved in cell wall biosynthesis